MATPSYMSKALFTTCPDVIVLLPVPENTVSGISSV